MAAKMAVACGQFALVDTLTYLSPRFFPSIIYGLLLSNASPSIVDILT